MDEQSVIAKRLKQARIKAGLSQKQLGIEAGIDQFTASSRINQYERGKYAPDFRTVERLANVLRVPPPYFYARDDQLAEAILKIGALSGRKRSQLLSHMRAMAGSDAKSDSL